MSDLQCPARFVLLTPGSLKALDARGLRLSALFVDASTQTQARAELERLVAAHGCRLELVDLHDPTALMRHIEQLADAYRGETVLLLAPERAVSGVLGCADRPARPVMIAVDSDGWNVLERA